MGWETEYLIQEMNEDLLKKVKRLELENVAIRKEKEEIGKRILDLNEKLHQKNLELDALHWVWCDGGCGGGVHRYHHSEELTEELVRTVEGHAKRLRTWFTNRKCNTSYPKLPLTEYHRGVRDTFGWSFAFFVLILLGVIFFK